MGCPERCPDCGWLVPQVPRGLPDGLGRSALYDHHVYDCPGGPQMQTAPKVSTVDAAVSP